MSAPDPRVPEPERRKIRRAIEDLEAAYDAGAPPDLAALAPPGPFRVPHLLALVPYDMRCRLKYLGDRTGSTVEAYLDAFPELRGDPDGIAQLALEEHAAHREAVPEHGGTADSTQHDPRARFTYRDRFPDQWPRMFAYTDTSRLPEPGERIGDWLRVERTLGRGGMGVVVECSDERLRRRVAVKLLDPAGPRFGDAVFRERFLREAEALARVDHPNVVKVYFAGLVAAVGRDFPYFVMEYIDGEPLDQRLAPGAPAEPAEVLRLARGLAAALHGVHSAGLVHRDVNPRNVMLRTDGTPVLLDLGLVRSADAVSLTGTGTLLGTVAYMAPEQADGGPVDGRADLFGLGGILYRAATGNRPFPGERITEVLVRIKTHTPPPPAAALGLPAGLGELIARLMAKRPEDRPQTAGEVLAELDAIEAGRVRPAPPEPKSAEPPGPPPPPAIPPRAPGRRARLLGIVAGAVVLGALALVATFSRGCAGPRGTKGTDEVKGGNEKPTPRPVYRGKAGAIVHRNGVWLPLTDPAALPLKSGNHFKVEIEVEPAAYLYVFWIEPDGEVGPLYPWNPKDGWGSRPAAEKPAAWLSLPEGTDFEPDPKKPLNGVTTIIAFACPEPLVMPDRGIQLWFKDLPRIERPPGDSRAVAWFDNFASVRGDPKRAPKVTAAIDPYERWHAALKQRVGPAVAFETSVCFAQSEK